jgi:hypothetical protein
MDKYKILAHIERVFRSCTDDGMLVNTAKWAKETLVRYGHYDYRKIFYFHNDVVTEKYNMFHVSYKNKVPKDAVPF